MLSEIPGTETVLKRFRIQEATQEADSMGESYRVVFDDGTDMIVNIERTDTVVLDDEYVHKLRSDWDTSPPLSLSATHEPAVADA